LVWHLAAVVAVARLAFFTPLPAGIGALESALPWVTATLGRGSTFGISLCLIILSRDLLFSLACLVLTMKYLTCRRKASIINNKPDNHCADDLLKNSSMAARPTTNRRQAGNLNKHGMHGPC
jgi:hypothetical protein